MYLEQLQVMRRVFGPAHRNVLQTAAHYAMCVAHSGRLDEAKVLLAESVEALARVFGADHTITIAVVETLAKVHDVMLGLKWRVRSSQV
jgi:arginase family enzyme